MGLDLKKFRHLIGATQNWVAQSTGLTQATISRIENRVEAPQGKSMILIQSWADSVAVQRDVPVSQRLTWDWVMDR